MPCPGTGDDHCCWLAGEVCKYLEENTVSGRRWACGLRRKLGSWDAVLASSEYQTDVAPILEPHGYTCKDWPEQPHNECRTCGWGVNNGN